MLDYVRNGGRLDRDLNGEIRKSDVDGRLTFGNHSFPQGKLPGPAGIGDLLQICNLYACSAGGVVGWCSYWDETMREVF
jgi:hypothetical protein